MVLDMNFPFIVGNRYKITLTASYNTNLLYYECVIDQDESTYVKVTDKIGNKVVINKDVIASCIEL